MVSSDSELSATEVVVEVLNGFNNCKKFTSNNTVIAFRFIEGVAVIGNDAFFTVAHLKKYHSNTNIAGISIGQEGFPTGTSTRADTKAAFKS